MSDKLTTKALQEIRYHLSMRPVFEQNTPAYEMEQHAADLLAELDRTRPEWVAVDKSLHNAGDLYHVAGIPNEGQPPRWVGRGRWDAREEKWYDEDTSRPFRFAITHWFHMLTPPELIGQPDGE